MVIDVHTYTFVYSVGEHVSPVTATGIGCAIRLSRSLRVCFTLYSFPWGRTEVSETVRILTK